MTTFFQDNFSGPAGTSIHGRVPDIGAAWWGSDSMGPFNADIELDGSGAAKKSTSTGYGAFTPGAAGHDVISLAATLKLSYSGTSMGGESFASVVQLNLSSRTVGGSWFAASVTCSLDISTVASESAHYAVSLQVLDDSFVEQATDAVDVSTFLSISATSAALVVQADRATGRIGIFVNGGFATGFTVPFIETLPDNSTAWIWQPDVAAQVTADNKFDRVMATDVWLDGGHYPLFGEPPEPPTSFWTDLQGTYEVA